MTLPTNYKHYYMFHKPTGCITAKTDSLHNTVMDYFSGLNTTNLHPIGRLDKDTHGLLLITDDGVFNQRLMHPENHIPKTYEFCVLGTLTNNSIIELEQGITLHGNDRITEPCKISVTYETTFSEVIPKLPYTPTNRLLKNPPTSPVTIGTITITEGRKHHIKRLMKYAGCYVIDLKRIAIGDLTLDKNLKPGQYRALTSEELHLFHL